MKKYDFTPHDFKKNVFLAFAYIGEKPHTPRTYQLSNMNEFGDINQLYPEDKKPIIPEEIIAQSAYDSGITQLNAFIDESAKRGAVVYFTFPPLCASEVTLNKASLTSLENLFRKKLHCKLLGTVKSFSYPDSLFFDTIYHLNEQGRSARTKQLIQLLDEQRGWSQAV